MSTQDKEIPNPPAPIFDPDGERLIIMRKYKEMNYVPENAFPKTKEYKAKERSKH